MKIYTRGGDQGETGLVGGGRIKKAGPQIAAIGSLDELNAQLGIIRSFDVRADLDQMLQGIQSRLFDVGAIVAEGPNGESDIELSEQDSVALESLIDMLEQDLTPLKKFILPGGNSVAAQTHLARTVCRRAERDVFIGAPTANPKLPMVFKYLNRLSDFLFVLARTFNSLHDTTESTWN
ncbi:MAG: cob(I)yrinic acid a,c-diamide adenosyltransferase [Pirellulales bacterium]|jgi:cob(I)alamin adenosyltransferase